MKVLEVLLTPVNYGGESLFVLQLLENLDLSRMQVDCLTVYSCMNEDFKEKVTRLGIGLYELHVPLPMTASRNNTYRPAKRFFAEHTYDVIHIHAASLMGLAAVAAATGRHADTTVIVHSHGIGRRFTPLMHFLRFCASVCFRRHVDEYCACSAAAAAWKFLPAIQRRTYIIHNGIDTAQFRFDPEQRAAFRKRLQIADAALVVGHVGRLSAEKNQAFLIRAFAILARERQDALLMLVGDGPDREALKALARQEGLEERVLFIGNSTEVSACLAAMDVFVFPSVYESFGMAAVEAQASGLPVIASDHLPLELRMTESFRFLPLAENAGDWADAILRAEAPAREAGAESVRRAGYDISYTVEQVQALYESSSSVRDV